VGSEMTSPEFAVSRGKLARVRELVRARRVRFKV
jgi:hypothetical protein